MDSVRNLRRRHTPLMIAVLAMTVVIGALGGEAWASAACIAGGGSQVGTTCQITTAVTTVNPALCPYVLALPAGEDLLITSTGSIKCDGPGAASGANITITVPGGQMEMQAGSEITSENTSGAGDGGNITITVSGDMILRGPGVAGPATDLKCADVEGACISSSNNNGGGTAGNITITVGNFPSSPPLGSFTMEPGSAVLANSQGGSAGAIEVKAGLVMDVDGLVRSFSGLTGTGGLQRPGGGPITLKSGCQLVITPDGVVSSEGRDPGADLVHLEGCEVTINGLVQSIALGNGGHQLPNNPANHCNLDTVTHPAVNKYTACVEVWANNITINSILPNKGQVNADGVTDNTTNDTRAWIDLFAKQNITINNDDVGPYSVHANAGNTEGDFGGLITIKAELGTFVSIGAAANSVSFAVQANAPGQSGNGGDVIIEAGLNVELNGAFVQAQGGASGTNRTGGTISVRSFNGFVLGNAPGVLSANAAAPLVGAAIGVITLQGCGTGAAGDGVNYTGTTLPAATILADQCGGQPTVPAAFTAALAALDAVCAQAPDCVAGLCNKSGRKFNDIAGQPGLPGWQICLFDSVGTLGPCQMTGVNGAYAFTNLACGEEFTFCEVLKPGWTQTFPTLPSADPRIVSCQGLVGPGPLGPVGYEETLVQGVPSEHNDFGNVQEGECPKFPGLTANLTITIDPGNATQIQDAINQLLVGQTLLILPHLGQKIENITINKRVNVVGCSITLTAADVSAPVVTIGAGAAGGSTTDVHATGSVAGYKLEGNSHLVKNVRSFGNAIGFWITGNSNKVVGSPETTGNGFGFRIDGDGNLVDSATDVSGNASHGAQLTSTANGNTIKKSTFTGNGGEGILVEGSGNTVSENKLYSNVLNGINVTASGTQILKNLAGDKGKGNGLDGILVSGNSGPLTENTARSNGKNGIEVTGTGHTLTKNTAGGDAQQANVGCEFVIGASNLDGQGGGTNKANGQNFSFGAGGDACVNP